MNLFDRIQLWRRNWAHDFDMNSLDQADRDTLSALARDTGLSEQTLGHLIARPEAGAELEKMLQALMLDPARLRQEQPLLMRDMALVCAECEEFGHCARDLRHGTAQDNFTHYCPNAEVLERLSQEEQSGQDVVWAAAASAKPN